ncbi:MAG: cupin domain-containing protein [Hyphomonadaceae bacterium]
MSGADARALIDALGLAAHPEGGWYRETWRAQAPAGGRSPGTAILFLLEAGQHSRWHQVDADELWLWHAGAALDLRVTDADGGSAARVTLGSDVLAGETPQFRVPSHSWQAATAGAGWALVSCVVTPGFEFAGFNLASDHLAARLDAAIPARRPG